MATVAEQVQHRYFELRFDGENIISGTAMRYGDTADVPWFGKERFEPGAFGDLSQADLALDLQHDRKAQVARTGGGGLEVTNSYSALEIRATLDPSDPDAQRVISKVKKGILRGLSVAFAPDTYRRDMEGGEEITVHSKSELRDSASLIDLHIQTAHCERNLK